MKLYIFVCKNLTNIWAGIGAQIWAVSEADPQVMAGRRTRARGVQIGSVGLIYCSDPRHKSLTTPFLITTRIQAEEHIQDVWPERWAMPFGIKAIGTPKKLCRARQAARELPYGKKQQTNNIASIFKTVGTAVFSPIEIEEDDWALIIERLGDFTI